MIEQNPYSPKSDFDIPWSTRHFMHTEIKGQSPTTYKPPLTEFDYGGGKYSLEYSGSLGMMLDQLESASTNIGNPASKRIIALHPPRIIRSLIEYKIAKPDSQHAISLLHEAIKLALDVYSNPQDCQLKIAAFRHNVQEVGDPEFIERPLHQPHDQVTAHAMAPYRSRLSAERLAIRFRKADLLFIALAHGGVAAGMDTFLYYKSLTDASNSEFYPARFSKYKSKDSTPNLTPEEIRYLQQASNGREVVIFDEDSSTGTTIHEAWCYFQNQVFPQHSVFSVTNLNAREELQAFSTDKLNKLSHSQLKEALVKQLDKKNSFIGDQIPPEIIPQENIKHTGKNNIYPINITFPPKSF